MRLQDSLWHRAKAQPTPELATCCAGQIDRTRGLGRSGGGAIVLVAALLVTACGPAAPSSSPAGSSPAGNQSAEPTDSASPSPSVGGGGTVTGFWSFTVGNLTVWNVGASAHFWDKIYGRLTTHSVKDPAAQAAGDPAGGVYGELIGDLAESWSVSDDGLTWTFNLRPDVTWHDGEPFTADDVRFTFDWAINPKNSLAPIYYTGALHAAVGAKAVLDGTSDHVTGVTVVDDHTVSITFETPNALFPETISELFIAPSHILESIPLADVATSDYWTDQVGTGPFKWDKYTAGESIELVPNEDYWRGAPRLDRIIARDFPDPATALLAFDNGELDFVQLPSTEVERERSNPNAVVLPGFSGVDNWLYFNPIRHPALADNRVRQALVAAIDRDAITQTLYGGAATPIACLYGAGNLTQGVEPIAFDPANARDLFEQAGVDPASLGEVTIRTYYLDQLSGDVLAAILQNWNENLGIQVGSAEQMEGTAYGEAQNSGDFDFAFVGGANGPTGDKAFESFHSSFAYPTGGLNGFDGYAYSNATLDRLLEQARQEFDAGARDALYQQACQLMRDEQPWLFLWENVRFNVANRKLKNLILIPAAGGGSYYSAAETWYKEP